MTKPHSTDRVLSFHSPAPPSHETPHGALLNALQIVQSWGETYPLDAGVAHAEEAAGAFLDVGRLIRHSLEGLGEPHPHTVELTRRYLEALCGRSVEDREARDLAAVVITSALKQEQP